MSKTTVQHLWLGSKIEDGPEFRNSHGSAAILWHFLWQQYVTHKTDSYYLLDAQKIWDLWTDERVPECLRAMLGLTFDRAYVKRDDFRRMATDIKNGIAMIDPPLSHANHWPSIAEHLLSEPSCEAIGLHCTSVSENPFEGRWNGEGHDPLDWTTCFDLYEELDSGKAEREGA